MKIKIKSVEDWIAKDFYNYIKSCCETNNIIFNAEYSKQNILYINVALKLIRLNSRTSMYLKQLINKYFEEMKPATIETLSFFTTLTRNLPIRIKPAIRYYKDTQDVPEISSRTKHKLQILKKELTC